MDYKRIKLDKFVSGVEQRVFKTTTNEITYLSGTGHADLVSSNIDKDIWYGEFSTQKRVETKINKKDKLSGKLINFHDINADYIINRPDKSYTLNLNGRKQPMVSVIC